MNRKNKFSLILMVMAMIFGYMPVNAADSTPSLAIVDCTVNDLEGAWAYDVQNVDPQYQKGVLHIAKESGKYVLNIQGAEGSMIPTEELSVDGNEVKFVVYVEGDRVAITLNFDGDTFSGEGSSSNGPFTLSGKRVPDPK